VLKKFTFLIWYEWKRKLTEENLAKAQGTPRTPRMKRKKFYHQPRERYEPHEREGKRSSHGGTGYTENTGEEGGREERGSAD